jgi:hypothetical protein
MRRTVLDLFMVITKQNMCSTFVDLFMVNTKQNMCRTFVLTIHKSTNVLHIFCFVLTIHRSTNVLHMLCFVFTIHRSTNVLHMFFDDKQTILKTEEESVKYINHVSCKSHTSNNYGNTAMNAGECNGLMKIIHILD